MKWLALVPPVCPPLLEDGDPPLVDPQLLVALALIVIILLLVFRITHRRIQAMRQHGEVERLRRSEQSGAPRAPTNPPRGDPEVERLYVDLESFAREIEARLDTKVAVLRRLLSEADGVAARLEKSLDAAAGGEVAHGGNEPPAAIDEPELARGSADEAAELGRKVDIVVGAVTDGAGETASEPDGAATQAVQERVLELHEHGRDPVEIADEVGLPKGEVELMIHLHETERGARDPA